MVIKASASAEIRLLVDALSGPDDVRRDAAAARLSVIGARAVERLLEAYKRAETPQGAGHNPAGAGADRRSAIARAGAACAD